FLKRLVKLETFAVGESGSLARWNLIRREAAIFPAVDHHRQHARRPALLVDILDLEELLEQTDLVVDVEDGEIGLKAHQLGVPTQDLHADRVERAEPRHALHDPADDSADAELHLAR